MSSESDSNESTPAVIEAGTIVENYKILQKIGEGAYSIVYEAQQIKSPYEKVAMKVYNTGTSKAFNAEVNCLKAINEDCIPGEEHPNITHIISLFALLSTGPILNAHSCVCFPLYSLSLRDIIYEDDIPIDTHSYMKQILNGLNHIHALNWVHGDIKPGNIMLLGDVLKIVDFNHAVVPPHESTKGSYGYSSPETMLYYPWDSKSDIWSVGCIFYELVTRRRLFDPNATDESSSVSNDTARSGSSSELSNPDEDYTITYGLIHGLVSVLGPAPRIIIGRGNNYASMYLNSKGYPRLHGEDIPRVDLAKHMKDEFDIPRRQAKKATNCLFDMLAWLPTDRLSADELLEKRFK